MGDFDGHPFRGNQYSTGAGAEAGARTHVERALRSASGLREAEERGKSAMAEVTKAADEATSRGEHRVAVGFRTVMMDPKYASLKATVQERAHAEMAKNIAAGQKQIDAAERRAEATVRGIASRLPGPTVSRGDYRARAVDNRGMPDRSGRGRSYAERVHEARTRELRGR
jgi:hypothetical protein